MKKITRWSPDTCGCIIEYEWDDSIPETERVHSAASIVQACPSHDGLKADKLNHFEILVSENRLKNNALKMLAQKLPQYAVINENGEQVPDLKKLAFTLDNSRKVVVSAKDISASDAVIMNTEYETKLGKDKAIVGA